MWLMWPTHFWPCSPRVSAPAQKSEIGGMESRELFLCQNLFSPRNWLCGEAICCEKCLLVINRSQSCQETKSFYLKKKQQQQKSNKKKPKPKQTFWKGKKTQQISSGKRYVGAGILFCPEWVTPVWGSIHLHGSTVPLAAGITKMNAPKSWLATPFFSLPAPNSRVGEGNSIFKKSRKISSSLFFSFCFWLFNICRSSFQAATWQAFSPL